MREADITAVDLPVPTRRLSPTDLAQFIRLGSCERFLRLRLVNRTTGRRVFDEQGTPIQPISALLTVSGRRFEAEIEAALASANPATRCGEASGQRREHHHAEIVRVLDSLAPGERHLIFQPRLRVQLGAWDIRGDPDVMVFDRDRDGVTSVLIADIKSSTAPKVEHRLQVAFYAAMLEQLLRDASRPVPQIRLGIIFKGPADLNGIVDAELREERAAQAAEFRSFFGLAGATTRAYLEIIPDPESYREAAFDLVYKPGSRLDQIADRPFDDVPYEFNSWCDGCYFNRFCLKRATLDDDVALLPYVSAQDRTALRRAGIRTSHELAMLPCHAELGGRIPPDPDLPPRPADLTAAEIAECEWQRARLVTDRQVGARLDELISRARIHTEALRSNSFHILSTPGAGDGTLPRVAPDQHPNLIWVYLDVQRDYIHDRLYLLGAKVVGCEAGQPRPERSRTIVAFADGPPEDETTERDLLQRWIQDVIAAISEVVADDPNDDPRTAPIHLVFFSETEQKALLDALARHAAHVLGATALYDFVTQLPAFDSPIVSIVSTEIRQRHLIPVVPQSLYRLSERMGFSWNTPHPFRTWFRERIFDWTSVLRESDAPTAGTSGTNGQTTGPRYYTARARFGSLLPLEYAYGAWGELDPSQPGNRRELRAFLATTPDRIVAFEARRLDAIEHIVARLHANRNANKRGFRIPELGTFENRASGFGQALQEFMTIERHVELQSWKAIHQREPEQRMLQGQTLIVEYRDADQEPEIRAQMRDNRVRYERLQAIRARQEPQEDGKYPPLTAEDKERTKWSQEGLRVRMRILADDGGMDLEELLLLSDLRDDDWIVLAERWTTSAKPGEPEREPYTPTARQLLWAPRAKLVRTWIETDGNGNRLGWAEVELMDGVRGNVDYQFVFGPRSPTPLQDGQIYTLDEDPNDTYGQQAWETVKEIIEGKQNRLFDLLVGGETPPCPWPEAAAEGQRRFYAGLAELERRAALHGFEPSKQGFIGEHGGDPILLVQGPPGTGKSYTTGFALFARLQGAMQADMPYHIAAGCKTHAATDVLMAKMLETREQLRQVERLHPDVFARYFDRRLLDVPIYRLRPRGALPAGVIPYYPKKSPDDLENAEYRFDPFKKHQWTFVGGTPSGIRALDQYQKRHVSPQRPFSCLVLDEASQMNLPESLMAARLLAPDGRLIVVGDHRQMPPIVKHDWENERRRTFWEYKSYASLFDTLRHHVPRPAMIQFAQSFRLHADMAEFLRREVYQKDGINYFSTRDAKIERVASDDPFVLAVLDPAYPLVVVVHDEDQSQTRNDFERRLIEPVLEELSHQLRLQPDKGLGVVVPHRAQRAAVQQHIPYLGQQTDDGRTLWAVDTVERFQGGERQVMVFCATESDPGYLLTRGEFLFDPRRLTVALSRAKDKMILVASRTVFDLFHADEEVFTNLQFWKRLLRKTCTIELWTGERDGHHVAVYGNVPLANGRLDLAEAVESLMIGADESPATHDTITG